MDGHGRRREKKKSDILSAARELFFARCYHEVKVEDVARLAQVSPASIYNFFGTKQTLLFEVIRQYVEESVRDLETKLDEAKSFDDQLMLLFRVKTDGMARINMSFLSDLDPGGPAARELIGRLEPYWLPVIRRVIERGKAEGVVSRRMSEEAMMLYVLAVTNGLLSIWGRLADDRAMTREVVGLFYFGLAGVPGAAADLPGGE